MRRLWPVIENNLVVRWKCDACNWRYCLKTPIALASYTGYALETVSVTFSAHDCTCDVSCAERKAAAGMRAAPAWR